MPRYIDLDKAILDVESVGAYYSEEEEVKEQCLLELKGQPIADVVPRSEVEKAKQEAYKEVFEEIEKKLKLVKAKWIDDNFYKLDGYELDCVEAMLDKDLDLAELEKKHIGKVTENE